MNTSFSRIRQYLAGFDSAVLIALLPIFPGSTSPLKWSFGQASGIACGDTAAVLNGKSHGGAEIMGTDSRVTTRC